MIRLHNEGGSQEVIFEKNYEDEKWEKIRTAAMRLLTGRGKKSASGILSSYRWRLCHGTNGFGDEFSYLDANLDLDDYSKLGERQSDPAFNRDVRDVAQTITELGEYCRFVVVNLNQDIGELHVPAPIIEAPDRVLRECLSNAEEEIRKGNSVVAVDRMHTALHAFLRNKCAAKGIAAEDDAAITRLVKLLRESLDPSINDNTIRILVSCAAAVDALNTIRNNHSLAHPNQKLLDNDEALLCVNMVKSIFSFLNAKA